MPFEQYPWVNEITALLEDPTNRDQDPLTKTNSLCKAKEGPITHLKACGISNGKIKQLVNTFYSQHKTLPFTELINGLNQLYHDTRYIEGHVFITYLIEKYKKNIDPVKLFDIIKTSWVDVIDFWITADHLAINVLKYIPVYQEPYMATLKEWRDSTNFWKRRLSIIAYIKHFKNNLQAQTQALQNIDALKQDSSYYVRKAIPWTLRTISQYNPSLIQDYLLKNYMYLKKTELKDASKKLPKHVQEELLMKFARK